MQTPTFARLNRLFPIFTTLILLLGFQSHSAVRATWLNQLTPLDNLQLVVTPEEDHSELIAAFQSAKSSIQVGIFGISSQKIADALMAAAKRNVKVTVICDSYCTSNEKRKAIYDQLEKAGVDMHLASDGFSITHWKMFVIDETRAFISTMNFISRADQMRDFGIFTTEPAVIQEILAVYKQDLANTQNSGTKTPDLKQPNLVWSPNNSETKLVELIDSADKTIEIWIENMGNKRVHTALAAAVRRGVHVRVLASQCGMGMTNDVAHANLKALADLGVDVRAMPFPATTAAPYIHAKSIHVDHDTLFMGSENFSANSLLKARELGVVFKDAKIQKTLGDLYEKDWGNASQLPEKPPENCSPL